MESIEAKLGRENHKGHLIQVLPLITLIFALQCFLVYKLTPDFPIFNFALTTGLGLIGLVVSLFYYDENHHVFLTDKEIIISFHPFSQKKISYLDITDVVAPKEECPFSSIVIKTQSKNFNFHFVDFPKSCSEFILKRCAEATDQNSDDFNKAA